MVRGKPLEGWVLREMRRLGAEGKSINVIKSCLEARGVRVGRSTISQYIRDVRPEAETRAGAKPEPVAPVERGFPQPDQFALRPEVRYMYRKLVGAGVLSKETSLSDFVNSVMMTGYEALREAEKGGGAPKENRDELARLIGKPIGEALGELVKDLLFKRRELREPAKFQ